MASCWRQRTHPQWAELMMQCWYKHSVTIISPWCHHTDISTMTSAAWCHVRVRAYLACMYVCLSVTLFCPFLKWSTNALRACVRVHVYMFVYMACFLRCEVKIYVHSWSEAFLLRGCVWMYTCLCVRVCVCMQYMCVCVCIQYMCVCVLVCAREWERASELARILYVG